MITRVIMTDAGYLAVHLAAETIAEIHLLGQWHKMAECHGASAHSRVTQDMEAGRTTCARVELTLPIAKSPPAGGDAGAACGLTTPPGEIP